MIDIKKLREQKALREKREEEAKLNDCFYCELTEREIPNKYLHWYDQYNLSLATQRQLDFLFILENKILNHKNYETIATETKWLENFGHYTNPTTFQETNSIIREMVELGLPIYRKNLAKLIDLYKRILINMEDYK